MSEVTERTGGRFSARRDAGCVFHQRFASERPGGSLAQQKVVYNTPDEIDALMDAVDSARELFA